MVSNQKLKYFSWKTQDREKNNLKSQLPGEEFKLNDQYASTFKVCQK